MSQFERPVRQKRRTFGVSWWGNAWVEAVEQLSDLDQNRLPRGRTYARWGYVGPLTVEPGVVTARVAGSKPSPYRTHVKVHPFTDAQWDALLEVVAGKLAHAAALIDGELTAELVDDATAVGVALLPATGDITTGCSCADSANPCKHAAAVCYLFADLLDDDPFVLLQLRGRTQAEVTEALRARRRQSSPKVSAVAVAGEVTAKEAFARRERGLLPHLPKTPAHPGKPAALPPDTPFGSDVDPLDLETLGEATAQRAWEMCNGVGNSGLKDSAHVDLVRRLAPLLDTPKFAELCSRTTIIRSTLEEEARLWAAGGLVALNEADASWEPDAEALEPAVALLTPDGHVLVRQNKVTCKESGVQLRLGESGSWYQFQKQASRWRFVAVVDL